MLITHTGSTNQNRISSLSLSAKYNFFNHALPHCFIQVLNQQRLGIAQLVAEHVAINADKKRVVFEKQVNGVGCDERPNHLAPKADHLHFIHVVATLVKLVEFLDEVAKRLNVIINHCHLLSP